MLLHCVFCDLPPDHDPAAWAAIMADLASVRADVPGMLAFEAGPNRDYERKSARWPAGFVCRFADRAAHLAYEAHPRHQAAGARLVAMTRGGHAGIIVFDLEV